MMVYDDYKQYNRFTPEFASLNAHKKLHREYKDDLESLFYSMLYIAGVKLSWLRTDIMSIYRLKYDPENIRVSCYITFFS